jgi:hypothetical protein
VNPLVIGGIPVQQLDGALLWNAGLAIDADGAPDAYAPADSGLAPLDALADAGKPGDWYGVVTDNGRPSGTPIVQGPRDPDPGYDISTTALVDPTLPEDDPRRFVDAESVPYLAVPPELLHTGAHLADVAMVVRAATGTRSPAVVADVGPRRKLGEGSVALANALGIDSNARHGGAGAGVACVLFSGSRRGWPRALDDITAQAEELFAEWGGMARLASLNLVTLTCGEPQGAVS